MNLSRQNLRRTECYHLRLVFWHANEIISPKDVIEKYTLFQVKKSERNIKKIFNIIFTISVQEIYIFLINNLDLPNIKFQLQTKCSL